MIILVRSIGIRASTLPEDSHPHKQIATIFKKRLSAIESGKGLDWGTAEALAFGSLLLEVRCMGIYINPYTSTDKQKRGDMTYL